MSPYVDLGDTQGYVEVHGSGEPVLLLHGGFCSLETWAGQIPALAERYEVHAPERPGQGRSADRPGPISFEQMVRDTLAYLDAAGLSSVHVVGFSDGAITGLLLALDHSERVRSLVAISANLDPSIFDDDEPEPEAGSVGDAPAPAPGESDVRAAYERLSPDGPEHADVVLQKLVEMWRTEPDIPVSDLTRIDVPTLVLAGDRDSIPTEHTVTIAHGIPGAALCVVPYAGHMVIEQRPEVVNQQVLEFLQRVTAR
jgi:pimeloyl-ACP methyl ester carboxylesterase